ncbi:MAG: NUDIX domain-containing protein [Nanoarchaeota archaeon]|nr:NUDIX domain-containing protein [Nanoarchaeota archaeon]
MIKDSAIILFNKKTKKILLQLRDSNPKLYPNFWSVFGGSVDEGESFEDAVKREALEELNYIMKNPRMILESRENSKNSPSPRHRQFFIEEFDSSQKLIQKEGADMSWFNKYEFLQIRDKTIPGLVDLILKIFEYLEKNEF